MLLLLLALSQKVRYAEQYTDPTPRSLTFSELTSPPLPTPTKKQADNYKPHLSRSCLGHWVHEPRFDRHLQLPLLTKAESADLSPRGKLPATLLPTR